MLKEHTLSFIRSQECIYDDIEWTKFTNPILEEHVSFIAVVDTELIERENRVS